MSERLRFKVDLQEALFRDQEDLHAKPDPKKEEKRLNRQDIEDIIESRMFTVKDELADAITENRETGTKLKD